MKLLFAEDEYELSEAVTDVLKHHKYNVEPVYDGEDALNYALSGSYDGIILDIMMPKLTGIEVLERLRKAECNTPVLLLTAKSDVDDKICGLDTGADDYLTKPFDMRELLARVRAMLRRKEDFTPNLLKCGNITLNQKNYELSGNGKSFALSSLEYKLMEVLMLNKGFYMSSEALLIKVWGYDTDTEIGIVWVYISYLRKKLAALGADVKISVKRNVGYTLGDV